MMITPFQKRYKRVSSETKELASNLRHQQNMLVESFGLKVRDKHALAHQLHGK